MPHQPPEDRRKKLRREEDEEQKVIADGAVEVAPIVSKLIKTGRVSASMAAIFTVLGGFAGGLGVKVVGPGTATKQLGVRIDTTEAHIRVNARRVDSALTLNVEMRGDVKTLRYILCAIARRNYPDLRPDGCDAK